MTLREAIKLLSASGVDSPEADAMALCRAFCGISPASALARRDEELSSDAFDAALKRRCSREPLQYILGVWGFMDSEFSVSPGCLIPRQDTELIADTAIRSLPHGGRLLDLCTGSGCIPISVLLARRDCKGAALELSEDALAVAMKNASDSGVTDRLELIRGDVLSSQPPTELENARFDVITANPPYIPSCHIGGLAPELAYEPRMALDGGEDGLDFYRAILSVYPRLLSSAGVMLLEIGFDQGRAVSDIAVKTGLSCRIEKDLAGLDRMAVVEKK